MDDRDNTMIAAEDKALLFTHAHPATFGKSLEYSSAFMDVVGSREASPFYLFRTCFVGLFLNRLVKSKVMLEAIKF